ncbi:MAG: DUF4097 family beta strand repeat-containing protein [Candidatus Bipolaricaulia bacterium]
MNRRVALSLAAVIGLAAALLLLAGCEEEDVAGLFGSGNVTASETDTMELVVELPVSLSVESSNGAVSIRGEVGVQTASVVVTRRSRGETLEEAQDRVARIDARVEQSGSRLDLVYRGSEQDDDVRKTSGVDFDVVVPTETPVNVRTSNGAIDVTSIDGTITLDTSNGEIEVRSGTGSLNADTSNGRVEVVDFVGDIRVDTSNGEVWLDRVAGVVDAETSNGSVRYFGTPSDEVGNRLRTSNGSITVRVPVDAAIRFVAHASSGKIQTELPLVGDTEGKDWSAELNPPAAITFDLRTSNGSIRIEGLP